MADAALTGRVRTVGEVALHELATLLGRFGVRLQYIAAGENIPGSFWGEPEAGIVERTVYARHDTPLHSLLHEACHIVCMTPARRASLVGDAGGDELEESAVCYLQILVADLCPGFDRDRSMRDMDAWGYSFRLGSTRRWFAEDADDARAWLSTRGLVDRSGYPSFRLRAA